jgi:hypothetical protein
MGSHQSHADSTKFVRRSSVGTNPQIATPSLGSDGGIAKDGRGHY